MFYIDRTSTHISLTHPIVGIEESIIVKAHAPWNEDWRSVALAAPATLGETDVWLRDYPRAREKVLRLLETEGWNHLSCPREAGEKPPADKPRRVSRRGP